MTKYMDDRDYAEQGELTVTITLAEYRELVRTSTLYEQELRDEPRPLDLDNIGEVE